MKHAGPATLDRLESLLAALREVATLKERSRGVFYLGSKPFQHFHEDPAGIYADLKIGGEFVRFRTETAAERQSLLAEVRQGAATARS